jgi:malonyl-CoA O-methyltransferase
MQGTVAEELVTMIKGLETAPLKVLDIGSGTGAIALQTARLFPQAVIFGCDIALAMLKRAEEKKNEAGANRLYLAVADAEVLPFCNLSFDLVVSNLTYQWLNDLISPFKEVLRILRPEGHFAFTLLGKDTMYELRYSYRNAKRKLGINIPLHVHTFAEKNYVYDCLKKNGFINIQINRNIKKEYHPDIKSIFSTLKAIGAQNASREAPRGLGRKSLFNWLSAFYEAVFKTPSGLALTYDIYYVTAEKG